MAQQARIYGYVRDSVSGEKMVGASVASKEYWVGVLTNDFGFYSLTLPLGRQQLSVSLAGTTKVYPVNLRRDTLLNFAFLSASTLQEVEISGLTPVNNDRGGALLMTIDQIRAIPALGSEVDVIKALQLLPGVKFGNEATTGLFVRGGSPDQNLILMDGVPIYNISHLFGFVSVFNPSAIEAVGKPPTNPILPTS